MVVYPWAKNPTRQAATAETSKYFSYDMRRVGRRNCVRSCLLQIRELRRATKREERLQTILQIRYKVDDELSIYFQGSNVSPLHMTNLVLPFPSDTPKRKNNPFRVIRSLHASFKGLLCDESARRVYVSRVAVIIDARAILLYQQRCNCACNQKFFFFILFPFYFANIFQVKIQMELKVSC